jgi:small-conductance mechanosensitive channel
MDDLKNYSKMRMVFWKKMCLCLFLFPLSLYIAYSLHGEFWNNFPHFALLMSLCLSLTICILEYRINNIYYYTVLYIKLIIYFILFFTLRLYLHTSSTLHPTILPQNIRLLIGSFSWLLLAATLRKFFQTLYISYGKSEGRKIPNIISKASTVIIFTLILPILLHSEFNISLIIMLESIAFASGALTLAAGFYFKEMITNILHGLLIALNPPFEIGDLIKTNNTLGFVEEYRWRSIKLRTFSGETVYIPNHTLSSAGITNVTNMREENTNNYNGSIKISVNPDHDPGWIKSLLMDALHATTPLHDADEFDMKFVFLTGYNEKGAQFLLVFNTSRLLLYGQITEILINIYRKFADAGVRLTTGEIRSILPEEQHFSLNVKQGDQNEKQSMRKFDSTLKFRADKTYYDQIPNEVVIQRSLLFKNIEQDAVAALAKILKRRHFNAQEDIIKHDEFSGGIHLIRTGAVDIFDHTNHKVAQLQTGNVFGEISIVNKQASPHRVTARTHVTTLFFSAEKLEEHIFTIFPDIKESLESTILSSDRVHKEKNRSDNKNTPKGLLGKVASWFFAL